ncbi:hypothetical protein EVAR_8606_1 [Eumeta japonica]|uniref:Uncharacterized protein n=1 Tax=Eumeta variegata TaxID=151549 RepID=A0A4C1XJ17_EUMVA|nr:hypothetical protein EVAR_8606_1 [Eumeta japonica]
MGQFCVVLLGLLCFCSCCPTFGDSVLQVILRGRDLGCSLRDGCELVYKGAVGVSSPKTVVTVEDDVGVSTANLLVDRIREAHVRATTFLHDFFQYRRLVAVTCPRASKRCYGINAVRDFRGATWKSTIDRAGESSRNLNQLCRQLIKTEAPKCPITDRLGLRRYDAKARAKVIVEHLAEQFIPNPAATSPPS